MRNLGKIWFLCGLLFLGSLWASVQAETRSWPAWTATTADGGEYNSRQLEGKVVVIAIWASWCPSCRKQVPVLNGVQRSFSEKEVAFLSFSFDKSEAAHRQFVQENGLGFPSIYARDGDGLRVVKLLQEAAGTLEAVPTFLIYNQRGQLIERSVGFSNGRQLEEKISPLLKR